MLGEIIKSYIFSFIERNLITEEKIRKNLDEIVKKYGLNEREVLEIFNEIRSNIKKEVEREKIALSSLSSITKEYVISRFNLATKEEVEKLSNELEKLSKKVDRSRSKIRKVKSKEDKE